MGFFVPSFAWLFLILIPPLVLLYFLKLKRPRIDIPSLVLWRQVLSDHRVNSPFQRFKRHILLWLQLLLLALLILAAMQPYWRGGTSRAHRIPVLIDNSASMAALDVPGGDSRLHQAKQQIRQIIDGLLPDQQLCLISFSSRAHKLTGFTNNKRDLYETLDEVKIKEVPSEIEDALHITQALSQGAPFKEAVMFSDRNFPPEADFALSFQLNIQNLDPAGPNLGITALSTKRAGSSVVGSSSSSRWEVFVSLESSRPQPLTATVQISQDGENIGSEVVSVSNTKAERLMFPITTDQPTRLVVKLKPDSFDSLLSDNTAYIDVDPARQLEVYVPAKMMPYRLALRAMPGVRLHPEFDAPAEADAPNAPQVAEGIDLAITDTQDALAADAPVGLYVGLIPEELESLLNLKQDGTAVVDWHRHASLLHHVQFDNLVVLDNPVSKADVRETDFENLGYEVLVHGEHGPLLLRKREGRQILYHMLFHADRSTLVYRVGFPIFLSNLVRIAMHHAGLLEARGHRTGVLPPAAGFVPSQTYRIRGPGGTRTTKADQHGILSGVPAIRVGTYTISGTGDEKSIPVSLLSPQETGLRGVLEIQFQELTVAAAPSTVKVDHPLWRTLALTALVILMVEWWFFQRRPGGHR